MTIQKIKEILQTKLKPIYLKINNTSHNPKNNIITHIQIIIVCKQFDNQNLLKRHQLIYQILENNILKQIHSISLNTYSISEWNKKNNFN
ncbi:BolA family protein [Enterobacteriaceae endosymbiont of Neohaemonia nigricornis]|uniref:BolA family protein n=1 Tax=Enterobacteriaceae endosymbiont of Neohaemonia nigricornis TaxID=2675792 RepID=UPI001448BB5B|nr:BolA family protein [Enterobacteriaceae endosymbiont of Neohaemonia nigricornis]QJC30410.1 BolA/IbaG family iron-sulfur metabolism protein [Enterobacteriaceae endosymbiont of Neohaemonia nigricornis]